MSYAVSYTHLDVYKRQVQTWDNQKDWQKLSGRLTLRVGPIKDLSLIHIYVPQYFLNIDRDKVQLMGLQLNQVFSTLGYYMAVSYTHLA